MAYHASTFELMAREQQRSHELAAEVERLREREAHFVKVLGVPDGGQYRNDWDSRITGLIAERDRLRAALEAIRLHHRMPAGESWEDAYYEVCSFAIEAIEAIVGEDVHGR